MEPKIVALDDPAWRDAIVVVTHRGRVVPLSRQRILEVLDREEDFFSTRIFQAQPSPPTSARPVVYVPPSATELAGSVTHASLSMRVKRIFELSRKEQKLRHVHEQLLLEIIAGFDWKIPKHPNTKLESHLQAIIDWKSCPAPLQRAGQDFLARYIRARGLD